MMPWGLERYNERAESCILGTTPVALLRPIASSLPAYPLEHAMLKPAPVKQQDKKRQADGRNKTIEKWEVGLGDPAVKPEQRAEPKQGDHPAGAKPGQRLRWQAGIPQPDGQNRKTEKQDEIESAPKR